MNTIELGFGKTKLSFQYPSERFGVLKTGSEKDGLTDAVLGEVFDSPIASDVIEERIEPGETVLIAVPDATRSVGAGQVVNLLVRRLIANGTMPYEISIILSTGLHRKVTAKEKERILTPFIVQRVKVLDHDPTDLMGFVRLGETENGIPVELNRNAVEADHLILVGGINFHYFAGFTGGRKLVCPGLASRKTVIETHSLAFANGNRSKGVGLGQIYGNPVHEAFVEAASKVNPTFSFNTFTNEKGEVTDLFCGDWKDSHLEACERFLESNSVGIESRRSLVIVSAGGFPHDINLIQAHKALETASYACSEGGTIILIAECAEGAGSREFQRFLKIGDKDSIAEIIAEKYAVGGQTAWSLLDKAERFELKFVSKVDFGELSGIDVEQFSSIDAAVESTRNRSDEGFIMPLGAKILPSLVAD